MDLNEVKNIFSGLPSPLKDEFSEEIISANNFKLERIISEGHSSPPEFWYDQDKNEFVLLVSGSAKLSYDDGKSFALKSGDYLIIPAHQKHRVDWTDPNKKTIWLALHY